MAFSESNKLYNVPAFSEPNGTGLHVSRFVFEWHHALDLEKGPLAIGK